METDGKLADKIVPTMGTSAKTLEWIETLFMHEEEHPDVAEKLAAGKLRAGLGV
jgi:hypothetical protein